MLNTTSGLAFEHERVVAMQAVRDAATLCRAVQRGVNLQAMDKKDRSPVTVADFGSQALVCRVLEEAFPADPVVAEEDSGELRQPAHAESLAKVLRFVTEVQAGVDQESLLRWIDRGGALGGARDRFWTLDPIDGTKGFLRGEQYAIALALIVEGRIEVAAMACPNLPTAPENDGVAGTGSLFVAVRGQGAELYPLDGDLPATPVRVSARDDWGLVRFCESVESGHSAHDWSATVAHRLGITAPPVRLDSQAKYAVVARGEADIYLRLPTKADYREKIWDHASGALILAEAGGVVTDLDGRPLDFARGRELSENRGVVATNGPLHDRVLAALAETFRPA
ncbi:3'(2'),5'-bisphosphate nucleotidase [Singulisphaera acidiphila]|uniref:3'(2'),5'-bisphosphate nucleotidase n=1 Tax=Singulisphaera acidiphila (strain ATCC BAA-1392 / DSM 18658 / VKM B-2454 / MOB10) TaxID=886293 RepID=L0DLP3_SINAD|nr:3'(2'),5'-bisphosphate nucleotidase [Singulisphaera acidiphila]AGA29586.1 3'(2'),5'-bisphosphate nucleotidase, HAL2 family [Singulisphaera acidiphila DSM 18658]